MEQDEAEVEEAGADRLAVDQQVRLLKVPAAWPDDQRGDRLVEGVRLLIGLEGEAPADRLGDRPLAGDDVLPGGGEGVLEVAHEDLRAAVEGVDHHLRLGRAGDLDPAVVEVGGSRCHAPGVILADRCGLGQEVGELAGVEASLALRPLRQQLQPARVEGPMQVRDECQRLGGQDGVQVRDTGAGQLDAGWAVVHADDCAIGPGHAGLPYHALRSLEVR